MPDIPSMPRNQGGSVPHWFVLAGGGVALVALFVLVKNRQSGTTGSTVAAGTSINAALGSLQEEMLNAQGTASTEARRTQAGISGLEQQNQEQGVALGQAIAANRELISLLPGGQTAYAELIASPGAGTMAGEDPLYDHSTQHATTAMTGTY